MIESIKTKDQISHPKYKVCHLVFINSILIVSQTRHRRFSVSKSVYNKISNVRKKGCPKVVQIMQIKTKQTSYILSASYLVVGHPVPLVLLSPAPEKPLNRLHQNLKSLPQAEKKRKNIRKKMRDDSAVVILFRFLNVSWKCFDQLLSC